MKVFQETAVLSTSSNRESRSEEKKFDAVLKKKNKEVEELKSSSKQLQRQAESISNIFYFKMKLVRLVMSCKSID